jgi:hypothetical protein
MLIAVPALNTGIRRALRRRRSEPALEPSPEHETDEHHGYRYEKLRESPDGEPASRHDRRQDSVREHPGTTLCPALRVFS